MRNKIGARLPLCLLVVAQSGAALAAGETSRFSVELVPRAVCNWPLPWSEYDQTRSYSCQNIDLGYALGRKLSVQVRAKLQLTGLGVRYRYDELTFTELRVDRRDFSSFSIIISRQL